MSLDSKYNKLKNFTSLFTNFRNLKPKKPETQLKKEQIMKNVDELYEKYQNAYKNDYDADELSEAEKKKIDYKQFELFDKTAKKLTLEEETKKNLRRLKIKKKLLTKKVFSKYFSYEPAALVNKLLDQNTQDLGKILDEIKQKNIKSNKDERNSRNIKN